MICCGELMSLSEIAKTITQSHIIATLCTINHV